MNRAVGQLREGAVWPRILAGIAMILVLWLLDAWVQLVYLRVECVDIVLQMVLAVSVFARRREGRGLWSLVEGDGMLEGSCRVILDYVLLCILGGRGVA